MDEFQEEEEFEPPPPVIVNVKLRTEPELEPDESKVITRLRAARRVIVKTISVFFTVTACCGLFWLEGNTIRQNIIIFTLDEMKQVETAESTLHLKNFVLILWTFAIYTLISEVMHILSLNDKMRLLEALRHRTKMESILSLVREKSYFDTEAVDFILTNQQNTKIEAVNDELGAPEMVDYRVHGLDPRRVFEQENE